MKGYISGIYLRFILTCTCMLHLYYATCQNIHYTFNKLGLETGLHDGVIRCIGQDKYGYIWVGSVGGVGKFEGKKFIKYNHIEGDSFSPLNTQCRSLLSDQKGRLWVGFENGLMQYNFAKNNFIPIHYFKSMFISSLCSISDDEIVVGTHKGIFLYNIKQDKVYPIHGKDQETQDIQNKSKIFVLYRSGNELYVGTSKGLIIVDVKSKTGRLIRNELLLNINIFGITKDAEDKIWICSNQENKILRWNSTFDKVEIFDQILNMTDNEHPYYANAIISDSKNRIWITTAQNGLLHYDVNTKIFIKIFHNAKLASSPSGNAYRCIFEDKSGLIWLGMEVEGINYFNPDYALFSVILPFPDLPKQSLSQIGRAVTTDQSGYFWFGNHDGLTKYNPRTEEYTLFRNEPGKNKILYSNHVKTLFCDKENNIWIGTGSGVNKYIQREKRIVFIDSKDLPLSFYNSINEDKSGNVWFCTNDSASLYAYNLTTKKYSSILSDPVLKRFKRFAPTSYCTEDSKGRLWISFARKCVVSYDKKSGELMYYSSSDTSRYKILSNLVVDIKEDKKGVIWFSSFQGINGIYPEKKIIYSFNSFNGLPGTMSGPIQIDKRDRIWAGINGGLTMISSDRKSFSYFNQNDGLSTAGFPEHAGVLTVDHKILFPTNLGYIFFDPENYSAHSNTFPYFITGATVMDKKEIRFYTKDTLTPLVLSHDETSFKIHFAGLNYNRPEHTRYAYTLEGFDHTWHITENPVAIYTNIPSGNYVLKMVSYDVNDDYTKLKPQLLSIHVDTVFYKTVWFISISILTLVLLLYFLYQSRLRHQQRLFNLQSKTQKLEKEKATAMFENLKQQLNPHFLFNSLSSLSGLIDTDKDIASKFLNQLSVIYRYILKNAENEIVRLKDEIQFAGMYVDLQKTRFSDGLKVNFDVQEPFLDKYIAPVTVQNMIENAIKHNIIDRKRPLVIDIFVEEKDYLVIKNNLQRKTVVETSNMKGLNQFITLYKYLTPRAVIIENNNPDHFIIKIPLL